MKCIQLSFITQRGTINNEYLVAAFIRQQVKKPIKTIRVYKKSLMRMYAEEIQRQRCVSGFRTPPRGV